MPGALYLDCSSRCKKLKTRPDLGQDAYFCQFDCEFSIITRFVQRIYLIFHTRIFCVLFYFVFLTKFSVPQTACIAADCRTICELCMDTERKRQGVSQIVFRHCMEEISRFPSVIRTGHLRKRLRVRAIGVSVTYIWMHWLKFVVQITYRLGVISLMNFGILTLEGNLGKRHVQKTPAYGSNTPHSLRERSQRFLLAT